MTTGVDIQAQPDAVSPAVAGSVLLRPACVSDLGAIQAIYAAHVLTGTGTFEEIPPDVAEMATRYEATTGRGLPYLVAEGEEGLRGFAYAAPYRLRSGYRFTVEDSIYLHTDAMGRGIGRALLAELVDRCTGLGLRQMIAVIGDSANTRSMRLHGALGFTHAGVLKASGYKFGRWIDSVIMQRPLGDGASSLPRA
jgi:phosphinothricin acetyltransferase